MSYKLIRCPLSGATEKVFDSERNLYIPFDPANSDYQKYLAWLAEGNEVLPPDEPVNG